MLITRNEFLKAMTSASVAAGMRRTVPFLQNCERERPPQASTDRDRISDIEIFPFRVREKHVMRITLGEVLAENVLVRFRTANGLTGWGESSPYAPVTGDTQATSVATGKMLADIVRGQDPFNISRIVTEMNAATTGNPGIKAAFEMALWDICGKLAGRPVCELLGNYRESFETDLTVYLDTPQTMAQEAEAVLAAGFAIIKLKLGESPEADVERVRQVRERVGNHVSIRIDANQGWSPAQAVQALKGIANYRVQFCEQPVAYWDWEGLKFVRDNSPVPIMADESVHTPHDAIQAVRREAVDMINIKLMKSGGILQSVAIAQIADAANMACMIGSMSETRIGLTAGAHLVCSQRNVLYADLDSFNDHTIDPVIGGMEVKDGRIHLPQSPGLGLDVDSAWLKTLRAA